MNLAFLFLFLILVRLGNCYNILVIFGHPGKSHYDVFQPLFQELGNRGHNLTIISHVSSGRSIKNSRDVLLSKEALTHVMDLEQVTGSHLQKYLEAKLIADFAASSCPGGLKSDNFQKFLKEDNQYDVILVEFFNSNCFYGLINKFKAPFIGLSSCSMMAWHPQWFGSPEHPSYIPTLYMAYSHPMTFFQRMENTFMHLLHKFWYYYFMERPGTELSRKYIGEEPADPYNASLYLLNTHYSLHGVRPLTPSIVEVGGIHVRNRKPEKLPEDIESWINGASNGVIYFSLGSLIKSSTFPKQQREIFAKVFAKLPQRVIWKWENATMENKPDNVLLSKWTPQFDILCNPKTKLFISHSGLLGTTEAVHCGVPLLVMPQFGDQPLNAKALEKHGAAVILKLRDVTEENLTDALKKALSSEYNQNAKDLSGRFRDRLANPLETSVYWVEHVAKYKGAQHMRSPGIDMPFYQYLLLDVFAFLGLICFIISYLVHKSLLFILRKCTTKKAKQKIS